MWLCSPVIQALGGFSRRILSFKPELHKPEPALKITKKKQKSQREKIFNRKLKEARA